MQGSGWIIRYNLGGFVLFCLCARGERVRNLNTIEITISLTRGCLTIPALMWLPAGSESPVPARRSDANLTLGTLVRPDDPIHCLT